MGLLGKGLAVITFAGGSPHKTQMFKMAIISHKKFRTNVTRPK